MKEDKRWSVLALLAVMLAFLGCDMPPMPETEWWKTDECSGGSPYNHKAEWSDLTPVFRFSTSLPSSWRDYAEYAAATWNQVDSRLQIKVNRSVVSADVAMDGMNVVSYGPLETSYGGKTYLWINASTGAIIEADIRINSNAPLSNTGSSDTYDAWSVLTHEFGHFCGLDHVNDRTHTMYPETHVDSRIYRTLCDGDKLGLRRLY